jgi:hypothetical protein
MKIPVLGNARAILRSWVDGEEVEPDVSTTGHGEELDQERVRELAEQLTEITEQLPSNRRGREAFDQRVAVLLGEHLPLTLGGGTEKRFWQWLAITQAPDVVRWRWSHLKQISENRWMGGWKDTFRRLWLRARIVHEPDHDAPYELAGRGDEDFWVGIIEREIGECPELVRALVRAFFPADTSVSRASPQRMEHYRNTIKRLRQIRPCRVFERMSKQEIRTLVEQTMAAMAPATPQSDGRAGRRRRPAAGRQSGRGSAGRRLRAGRR